MGIVDGGGRWYLRIKAVVGGVEIPGPPPSMTPGVRSTAFVPLLSYNFKQPLEVGQDERNVPAGSGTTASSGTNGVTTPYRALRNKAVVGGVELREVQHGA